MIYLIGFHLRVGAKVSRKFTPCSCSLLRATILALKVGGADGKGPGLSLYTHLDVMGVIPGGRGTRSQMSFLKIDLNSVTIAPS